MHNYREIYNYKKQYIIKWKKKKIYGKIFVIRKLYITIRENCLNFYFFLCNLYPLISTGP